MTIRKSSVFDIAEESEQDLPGIRAVNIAAFKREEEADIVDRLRKNSPVFISMVAKVGEKVVGHVLFTSARLIQDDDWSIKGVGLAPLAVLPDYQGQGIGSALCMEGLSRVSSIGYPFAVVLGHPAYYPRFGFQPASNFGIKCTFKGVPDDAFMIKILNKKIMDGAQGVIYYRHEFDQIT